MAGQARTFIYKIVKEIPEGTLLVPDNPSVSPVVLSCLEGKVVIPPGGRNCQGRFNRVQTPTISLIPPGIHPPLSRLGS